MTRAIAWGIAAWFLVVCGVVYLRGSIDDLEIMGAGFVAYVVVVASVSIAGYFRKWRQGRISDDGEVERSRPSTMNTGSVGGDKPTLASFGLSEDDVRLLEGRKERLASRLNNAGALTGGLGGFAFAGIASRDLMAAFAFGFSGWIVGSLIAQLSTGAIVSLVEKRDPRVQRHGRFQAARNAFEARLREAEERERRKHAAFWQSLSGHRFEHELGRLFKQLGYSVKQTPGSGDGGIDIVLRRGGKTTIVQCKQTKHAVAPAVARELYGALIASNADDGILAVTGGVSSGVRQFIVGKPLRVMDLSEIMRLHNAAEE
jgi:hypothetical protein